MSATVTLTFPDQFYERAKQLARQRHLELEPLLVDEITKVILAKTESEDYESEELTYEPDAAVEQEKAAYTALFPFLRQHYLGKHVAIYHGKLVDHDVDYGALYQRIDESYPNDFVWIDTVGEEPLETITLRSPIFVEK